MKLGNPKNAFWEAFFLAAVVFVVGLLLGIAYEASRLDKINEYYAESEIFLMDALALHNLASLDTASCEILVQSNIKFADRIYGEARLLEKYEDAGKMTDYLWLAHRKYDLLRTFLWINTVKTMENCEGNFSVLVYLYEYEADDLSQKATQKVWSRILSDLKEEKGEGVILIPIAVDTGLTSLDSLIEKFEISQFPVVIINEEHVIEELSSVEELKKYLE